MPKAHQGAIMVDRRLSLLLRSGRDDRANAVAAHARFRPARSRLALGRHAKDPHGAPSSTGVPHARRGIVDPFVRRMRDEGMIVPLDAIAGRFTRDARITVLTGAGVSAASGVPTFRGAEGLWKQYRAEELATPQAFARDPRLVWEWYD